MKKQIKLLFILGGIVAFSWLPNHNSYAAVPPFRQQTSSIDSVASAFRSKVEIKLHPDYTLPTIMEVIVSPSDVQNQYVLYDMFSTTPVHTLKKQQINKPEIGVYLTNRNNRETNRLIPALHDENVLTDYRVPTDGTSTTTVFLYSSDRVITASRLRIQFAENAILPDSVSLYAQNMAGFDIDGLIVSNIKLQNGWLYFPKNSTTHWDIVFSHTQPLHITEIEIIPENPVEYDETVIRFLAQPDRTYWLFIDPDRVVTIPYAEYTNLDDPIDTKYKMHTPRLQSNPLYIEADSDLDGIMDELDNCPAVSNVDQKDINENRIGDACEDFDRDGVMNNRDNCPNNPNSGQHDADSDGYGDICDPEESRLTERIWWLPWLGIVVGFGAVMFIFKSTVQARKQID